MNSYKRILRLPLFHSSAPSFARYINLILLFILLLCPASVWADSYVSVDGSAFKVIEETPESNSGLNKLFVVRDISGTKLVCKGKKSGSSLAVYNFDNAGAAYAQVVSDVDKDAQSIIINSPKGDSGYYIEEDGIIIYYFWIVNYADHVFSISDIKASPDSQCDATVLDIVASAAPIYYYGINANRLELSRDIKVSYTTQEYSADLFDFVNVDKTVSEKSLSSLLYITPPVYCSTYFTITGDKFLKTWGAQVEKESVVIQPTAVACKTRYVNPQDGTGSEPAVGEDDEDNDEDGEEEKEEQIPSNIIKNEGTLSAPADISFYAATTEAAIFYEWQVSRDPDFNDITTTSPTRDFDYTFNEEGKYYVQFIAASENDYCITAEQFEFQVGSSELICPNAFSPNGDGVNDIWKVSYRSLIDFHCEIFNRNGQPIYSFSDPNDGWDGTYHGKKVKSGVYYYVIVATGADGQKYKKSGDINIIYSRFTGGSTAGDDIVDGPFVEE